jgi:hypothetical protein
MIGFADGFNPCSLWILSVLIGLTLHAGREKILTVGGTFLVVTGIVYGLFVAGVFTAMDFAGQLDAIRFVVAVFAIGFALVSIKDYFAFGRGVSFTIPDRFKSGIVDGLRDAVRTTGIFSTVFATAVMAGGVALAELPCTSGFPIVWSKLVETHHPSLTVFVALVGVYIVTYLSVEVGIITVETVSMDRVKYTEEHGQVLKLFAGIVLFALGVSMVVSPEILGSVSKTVGVFVGSVALTVIVVVGDRFRTNLLE